MEAYFNMLILDQRRKTPQYLGLGKLIHKQSKNIYLTFKFKIGVKVIYMYILYMETFGIYANGH